MFPTPTAALDAIATALSPLTTRIHTGSAQSGATLDCCTDAKPLIRVETANGRAPNGVLTLHGLERHRCKHIVLQVSVIYLSCFQSFDGDGPEAVTLADATEQGRRILDAWWTAVGLLACNADVNQVVRFTDVQDLPPEGGCAGWMMSLEADVQMCACPDV